MKNLLVGLILATALAGCSADVYTVSRVVDGDTVKTVGTVSSVRLATHDTPEIFHPLCQREYERGMAAKRRLETILAQAGDQHRVTRTECWRGASQDLYGRWCGILEVFLDGRTQNVGDILIKEGLAVPFPLGHRPDWCGGSSP